MWLEQAADLYLEQLSASGDRSPHTTRAYAGDLAQFCRFVGKDTLVRELSTDMLIAFAADQRSRGLSSVTVRRRVAAVHSMTRWLHARGLILDCLSTSGSVSRTRSRRLPKCLVERDLSRLLLFLERDVPRGSGLTPQLTNLLAVSLLIATGIRVSELTSIRCEDIDLEQGSIRILGKGSRDRTVYVADSFTHTLLDRYLAVRSQVDPLHAFLLLNRQGHALSSASLRDRLLRSGRSAGITRRVTPHMLRHSAATQLIERGVDIRFVQRLLGHSSLAVTEIYTHISDTSLRQVLVNANVVMALRNRE
jgi:integrase/recombinase XerD